MGAESQRGALSSWLDALRRDVSGYRECLREVKDAEAYHRHRNGLEDDEYVRPGLTVEIPLLWGTF